MNPRERFWKIMRYEPVDRVPVLAIEPYEETALGRWFYEGLMPGFLPEDSLGMDRFAKVPADFSTFPRFKRKVFFENSNEIIETDVMYGAKVKKLKRAPSMFYGYIEHFVKDKSDWERMKERFDARLETRMPVNFNCLVEQLNNSQNPVLLTFFPYFMRLGFYLMGMERFLTAFYDTPDLIHDMFSFWNNFVLSVIQPYLSSIKIDCAVFAEDLAYKNAPHISPDIYKEFWLPYQDVLVKELKKYGVSVICLWTAGDINVLIPTILEHGVNCIWPVERCSKNMNPLILRKKYGKGLLMGGGISKHSLIEGPDAIDKEIEELMPLIKEGGFIPALDDMVPSEVPLSHYRYYIKKLYSIKL